MKKLISLLLFVLFVSINVYSQTTARKYEYAIIHSGGKRINIDYGNNRFESFKELMKSKSKDTDYTDVDALNYMDEQGYELFSTYIETSSIGAYGYNYVFKREIKK